MTVYLTHKVEEKDNAREEYRKNWSSGCSGGGSEREAVTRYSGKESAGEVEEGGEVEEVVRVDVNCYSASNFFFTLLCISASAEYQCIWQKYKLQTSHPFIVCHLMISSTVSLFLLN